MARANDDTRLSLSDVLTRTAKRHPKAAAVKWEGGTVTWAAFDAQVNRVARVLRQRGVRQGDVVGILMDNRPSLLIIVAATARLGAAASLLNTQQRAAALTHSLSCAPPRLMVVGEELVEAMGGVICDAPMAWVADTGKVARPPRWMDLLGMAAGESATPVRPGRAVKMGDPAFYIFTSGTTGLPKASVMSHKRWIGAGLMFGSVCLGLSTDDTIYAPLPLYHNQALTLAWSTSVRTGCALAIRRRFSATEFWDDCRRYDATTLAYIGEIARYLLNQPRTARDRHHRVTRAVGVGLRPELWDGFKHRFGITQVCEYYSASELNAGFFNVLNLNRTVGWCPVPWALVEWDADAAEPKRSTSGRMNRLGRGKTGLLITRVTDRFRFEGYTDKKATEEKLLRDVFEDGDTWVNTGDLMKHLGFGHLQFVDRIGDTFRWKGENVATTEVEAVVGSEPTVKDVAAYGVTVPHASGRAGMLSLVATNGRIDTAGLLARLSADLPSYAIPVFLRVRPELEVTATFKHVKRTLQVEGFDPTLISDPLFVRLPGQSDYVPLTTDLYRKIHAQEVSL